MTRALWKALDQACAAVSDAGLLWVSLYTKGPNYRRDLALKQKYAGSGWWGRKCMELPWIWGFMWRRLKLGQNPFLWNQPGGRGMNTYHDLVDWLGGLPYEVASPSEVQEFCEIRGLRLERLEPAAEGGCSVYLFSRGL